MNKVVVQNDGYSDCQFVFSNNEDMLFNFLTTLQGDVPDYYMNGVYGLQVSRHTSIDYYIAQLETIFDSVVVVDNDTCDSEIFENFCKTLIGGENE